MRKTLAGIIIIICLFGSLLFFLPSFNYGNENYIQCKDCHASQEDEKMVDLHKDIYCRGCHVISEFSDDRYTHEASIKKCTNCHEQVWQPIVCNSHWCKE